MCSVEGAGGDAHAAIDTAATIENTQFKRFTLDVMGMAYTWRNTVEFRFRKTFSSRSFPPKTLIAQSSPPLELNGGFT